MIKQSWDILLPYAEKLNELLLFQAHTDITSLAPIAQPRKTLFSSIFASNTQPPIDVIVFAKKVEDWSEYLLREWIAATKNIKGNQLEKLRLVASKIQEEQKIGLIRKALSQLAVNEERINSALSILENRVLVILAPSQTKPSVTPAIVIDKHPLMAMEISHSPPEPDRYFAARSFSDTDANKPLLNAHYDRRLSRHIDARILDIQAHKERKKALAAKMRNLFLQLKREGPFEYARFLAVIKNPDEWHAYGRSLSLEEANNFLGQLLNDSHLHQYIPRLLICLRFQVLEKLLYGINHEQLDMINHLFIESDDCKQEWFIERFKKKCQKYTKISNTLASEIDNIDKRFRQIEPTWINNNHNEDNDNLVARIQQHKKEFEAFSTIVKGAFKDHTTIRLITGTNKKPSELAAEYQNHLDRMSQDPDVYSRARGCPYAIINDRIFADNKLDDEDEPAEIFACWGILGINDYLEVGLVNDLPEHVRRDWTADPSLGHKMARCFALKKLAQIIPLDEEQKQAKIRERFNGIYLWKHLRIYNKFMLQKYLAQPDIAPHFSYNQLLREFVQRVEEID